MSGFSRNPQRILVPEGPTDKAFYAVDYGVVADGVTDDRAALIAVFADAIVNMPCSVVLPPRRMLISNGIEVLPPQGSDGLAIIGTPGATEIRYSGDSAWNLYFALDIKPSVTPTVGTYSQYLSNVRVEGVRFVDEDASTHAGGDQTHGLSIGYCQNAQVVDCAFKDVGDEAITLKHCRGGEIKSVKTSNTPSLGTDSGAITVQHGSSDINISQFNLFGSATEGTQSTVSGGVGIHLEVVSANAIENVTISGGTIKDFETAGIQMNNAAAADIDGVAITDVVVRNCDDAVKKRGTAGSTKNLNVSTSVFRDCTNIAINFDAGKTNTLACVLTNNIIDGATVAAMKLQVTGASLSNNYITNTARGIHIFDGDEIDIIGTTFKSCGGSLQEEIEVETGSNITAKGVKILDSNSSSACIKGVQVVEGCEIEANGAINQENRIFGVERAIGNIVNGGIRFASVTNVVAEGNYLSWNDTGGANSTPAIDVGSANDDARIQNNIIDMSGSSNNQYCIDVDAGASGVIVTGNNLKSLTAGAANALNGSPAVSANNVTT